MTEKQAEAEIRYWLAKFLLFRLQEENLLTPEESEKARQTLCKKYKPLWLRRQDLNCTTPFQWLTLCDKNRIGKPFVFLAFSEFSIEFRIF